MYYVKLMIFFDPSKNPIPILMPSLLKQDTLAGPSCNWIVFTGLGFSWTKFQTDIYDFPLYGFWIVYKCFSSKEKLEYKIL